MRIGIYGGSFDPPHFGHVGVVEAVANSGLVDMIAIVPSYNHRFKKRFFSFSNTLLMLRNLFPYQIKNKTEIFVCPIEYDCQVIKGSMFRLIFFFKKYYDYLRKKDKFSIIIGSDLIKELSKWHKIKELIQENKFIIVRRNENDLNKILNKVKIKNYEIIEDNSIVKISSSEIKKNLATYIPNSVLETIGEIVGDKNE